MKHFRDIKNIVALVLKEQIESNRGAKNYFEYWEAYWRSRLYMSHTPISKLLSYICINQEEADKCEERTRL